MHTKVMESFFSFNIVILNTSRYESQKYVFSAVCLWVHITLSSFKKEMSEYKRQVQEASHYSTVTGGSSRNAHKLLGMCRK